MLPLLLGLLAPPALYFFLLAVLPPRLPVDAVRRPLRWAHWGSGALILAAVGVCGTRWELSIRYPAGFALLVVGSGLVAGLRARLALVAGGGRLLARAQAWGTPVLLPGLWCWYAWRTADVVYWDAHVSLELTESTGWRSGVTSQSVTLYRARGVLFEQLLGDVHVTQAAPVYPDHPDQVLYHKDWWPVVRAVTVDEKSRTGVLRLSAGSIPFRVTE